MISHTATKRPAWTPEAEALLRQAPPFIVPFARRTAEKEAVRRGLDTVSAELMRELAARHSPRRNSGEFRPEDGFAQNSGNPLYNAFPESTLTNDHGSKLGAGIPESEYPAAWREAAARLDRESPKALYLHTPFCATRCKYCGFFVNGSEPGALRRYTDDLVRELEMILRTEGLGDKEYGSVYFGGGTPSDLDAESLKRILATVRQFNLAADCEITLEGRISSITQEKIAVCREYGVNRYSLGVQSFDTALRQSMGRISSRQEVIGGLRRLRETGDAAVVIDQIYGLPGQTMRLWEEDVKTLFGECPVSGVDHYPLIRMPGTPLDRAVSAGQLPPPPSAAERADMFCRALDLLEQQGAKRISLKHFAFDDRERNRYNRLQAYSGNCVPAGCGGGGAFGGYFFYQGGTLKQYHAALERGEKPLSLVTPVTPEDERRNRLAGDIQTAMRFTPATCAAPLLAQYEACGLLTREPDGSAALTRAGQFWNNAILQNLTLMS